LSDGSDYMAPLARPAQSAAGLIAR
jgi:hypothetical protein